MYYYTLPEMIWDKIMDDKLLYIPSKDEQNYPTNFISWSTYEQNCN